MKLCDHIVSIYQMETFSAKLSGVVFQSQTSIMIKKGE